MSRHCLTVVGSIDEDITAIGERLPRPGETVVTSVLLRTPRGKGANQAAAAARLGGRVRMVGAAGENQIAIAAGANDEAMPAAVVERCDLFVVNEDEHAALPELDRARLVAVTHGAAGAVILRNGKEVARSPAPTTTVVSTDRAGDSFCAAIVLAMLSGRADTEALEVACAVGAAAAASPWTQPAFSPLHHYLRESAATEPFSPATT
jgi:sugar/nucleoside kinase (ribokinase family)